MIKRVLCLLNLVVISACQWTIPVYSLHDESTETAWLSVISHKGEKGKSDRLAIARQSKNGKCGEVMRLPDRESLSKGGIAIAANEHLFFSVAQNFLSSLCKVSGGFFVEPQKRYRIDFISGFKWCVAQVHELGMNGESVDTVKIFRGMGYGGQA